MRYTTPVLSDKPTHNCSNKVKARAGRVLKSRQSMSAYVKSCGYDRPSGHTTGEREPKKRR